MKRPFLVGLLLLSSLGILTVLCTVPKGAGGLYDSVVYIGMARNLASGSGFYLDHRLPNPPASHWTPLYPMILAIPTYLGIDPAESARWFNSFFLACSIFLTGFIAWTYCGRSYAISFLAALLILFSPDIIKIHSQVLSEAPFIALVLVSIAALLSYAEYGKTKHLTGVAIAISAALLTRYAGVFLLPAACIILALIWRDLRQRSAPFMSFGLALMIAILPPSIWIIHNVLVKEGVVGYRKIVFHPLGLQHLRDLVGNVTLWFAPPAEVSNYLRSLVLVALLVVVFGIIVSALRSERRTAEMRFPLTLLLAEICLVFDVAYILVLCLTISFFDASTPLDMRLLIPIYPVTALLLISSLALSRKIFGYKSVIYLVLLGISILILGSNAARFFVAAHDIRSNGVGFQTEEWRDDEIMRYVQDLPRDTVIYSNNSCLIYYATQRASYPMPAKLNLITTLANNEYENQMKSLAELATRQSVVIILFHTRPDLIERWGFRPILRSAKGNCVFSASVSYTDIKTFTSHAKLQIPYVVVK